MDVISRNKCVLTGRSDLVDLTTFENFPIFMGATNQDSSLDRFMDMKWTYSLSSQIIQLLDLPKLEDQYIEQTTTDAVGQVWKEHHKLFAKFISEDFPKTVLEIGGAHGLLSTEYNKEFANIPWRIIEPNPAPVKDCHATFLKMYFNSNTKIIEVDDMIIHSHTLEHIYNPMEFLMNIADQLKSGQKMLVSIPNLEEWFKSGHANALNFEHNYLLTESLAERMFINSGFEIRRKQYFKKTHSIFLALEYVAVRKSLNLKPFFSNDLFPEIFINNITKKKEFVKKCNSLALHEKSEIFLFGAHIFSQLLINLGLDSKFVFRCLDNDKSKTNRRLY